MSATKKTPTYVRTVRTAGKTETFSLCLIKNVYVQRTTIVKFLAYYLIFLLHNTYSFALEALQEKRLRTYVHYNNLELASCFLFVIHSFALKAQQNHRHPSVF